MCSTGFMPPPPQAGVAQRVEVEPPGAGIAGELHGQRGMGGEDHGAPGGQPLDAVQHVALHGGVEMRGRFVEQQQRRVLQEGPGDGDALRLAAGKAEPAFADAAF